MSGKIRAALETWLAEGGKRIGEILIPAENGCFTLLHHADRDLAGSLQIFTNPEDALEISRYDAAGEYRPLKSAPNLRRGWELRLPTVADLHEALDFFYPATLGAWLAHREGRLAPVHFRETAGRQSGMYDVVKKIPNEQAGTLIGNFCRSDGGCLKTILWKLDPGTPVTSLPAGKFDPGIDQTGSGEKFMPLLCAEACNLLVAAARAVVRKPGKQE